MMDIKERLFIVTKTFTLIQSSLEIPKILKFRVLGASSILMSQGKS
jgi:hypothetical protein